MNNCFKEYFDLTPCITHVGDNTPPSLTCPPNIQTTAVRLQTWAVVSWAEPTANDDRDGGITYEKFSHYNVICRLVRKYFTHVKNQNCK